MSSTSSTEAPAGSGPRRLVLDTNVVLDLLLFRDPGVRAIKHALRAGGARCFSDAACLEELRRVLDYPQFGLEPDEARQILEEYRLLAQWHDPDEAPGATSGPPLPLCRDPDDQKFLLLARAVDAHLLVTKDKALLALARRKFRLHGLRVVSPKEAAAALAVNLSAPAS